MKKMISVLAMIAIMVFGLSGCSDTTEENGQCEHGENDRLFPKGLPCPLGTGLFWLT